MLKNSFLLFLMFTSAAVFSQRYAIGKVAGESGNGISGAMVFNVRTDEKVLTDRDGNFAIRAEISDELRFAKDRYERLSRKLSDADFSSPLNVVLPLRVSEIPEVEIAFRPNGDLAKDVKTLTPVKKENLNIALSSYNKMTSSPEVLAKKGGDFVQPKGQGFSIGKINNKWDKIDFYNHLIAEYGEQNFAELKISKAEIDYFLDFALKDFNAKSILKYGFYTAQDFAKIKILLENKSLAYHNIKILRLQN